MKAYVINLDRSPDRLEHIGREFGRLRIPFTRVSGVDTLSWSAPEIEAFFKERPCFPEKERVPGDAGAFLSHVKAWQAIAADSDAVAAVFEDDVHLAADVRALFAASDWVPADADTVRLESNSKMVLRAGRPIGPVPGRKIYRAESGTWGAAGYVITKDAAIRLAATPPALHSHIDWFLFKPMRSTVAAGLRRYQIVPALCIQDHYLNGESAQMRSIVSDGVREVPKHPRASQWEALLPHRKRAVPFQA